MFPRWFYKLMIAGYLANICATIPHAHPPGGSAQPHIHTNWLMGVEDEAHAANHRHSDPSHRHTPAPSHAHGQRELVAFPSADRPDPQHDHDCLFLAASGTAIAAAKTMPPESDGAVAAWRADFAAVATVPVALRKGASTQDLADATARHCAHFLKLRVLRI